MSDFPFRETRYVRLRRCRSHLRRMDRWGVTASERYWEANASGENAQASI